MGFGSEQGQSKGRGDGRLVFMCQGEDVRGGQDRADGIKRKRFGDDAEKVRVKGGRVQADNQTALALWGEEDATEKEKKIVGLWAWGSKTECAKRES